MRKSLFACKQCLLVAIELGRLFIELVKVAQMAMSPAKIAPANLKDSAVQQESSP